MSHVQTCEMKPLHFGPRHAISIALTVLRDLLQTKLMGRLSCTRSPSWHYRSSWMEVANLMALPRTKKEQSHWLGFWMTPCCSEGRRKALFSHTWPDCTGIWTLWSDWSLRCPKAWLLPSGVLPVVTGPVSMLTLSFGHIVQRDRMFLECFGQNGPCDFGDKTGSGFVLQSTHDNSEWHKGFCRNPSRPHRT